MGLGTWIRNQPAFLERAYQASYATIKWLQPLILKLGFKRASRLILPVERFSKRLLFDCKMCGQCTLHETGMVCPMTCPKHLRNGACGGVRSNGNCEVIPEMRCVGDALCLGGCLRTRPGYADFWSGDDLHQATRQPYTNKLVCLD